MKLGSGHRYPFLSLGEHCFSSPSWHNTKNERLLRVNIQFELQGGLEGLPLTDTPQHERVYGFLLIELGRKNKEQWKDIVAGVLIGVRGKRGRSRWSVT